MPKSVKKKRSAKTKRKYKNRKPSKKLNRKQLKNKSSKRKSKKKQSGGFKKCEECDLSNSFKDYVDELRDSLNISKFTGGGYSVTPDMMVGNLPVIKQYDDNNPPSLVNKKLINSKC